MKKIVILISGRGSNMQAVVNARIADTEVAAVISNRADAAGLAWAQAHGLATHVVSHQHHAERALFDAELMRLIDAYAPDLVLLAGFMRILTADFCRHYAGRLMNIHPSLLPAFTGLHTHQRAIDSGCRMAGCTVHFVTPELDCGPIITQAAVPILDNDTAAQLAERVLHIEHRVLPEAVAAFMDNRLSIQGNRVVWQHHDNQPVGAIPAAWVV